jgi:short subunit fatty acids transporter
MTETASKPTSRDWLKTIIFMVLGTLLGFIGAAILGASTGVIAMCSWAPGWWDPIYFVLAFALVFVIGPYLGFRFSRPKANRYPSL